MPAQYQYLDNVSSTTTATTLYNSPNTSGNWGYYPYNVNTIPYNAVYVVGSGDTAPEPAPAKPKKARETAEEWLRRRIDEVCWKPDLD